MKSGILDFVKRIISGADERPTVTIYGPWYPINEADRKFISDELLKAGFKTIRLSEHADLHAVEALSPEEIEECKKDSEEAYEEAVQVWREASNATIIRISIIPDASDTPLQ